MSGVFRRVSRNRVRAALERDVYIVEQDVLHIVGHAVGEASRDGAAARVSHAGAGDVPEGDAIDTAHRRPVPLPQTNEDGVLTAGKTYPLKRDAADRAAVNRFNRHC